MKKKIIFLVAILGIISLVLLLPNPDTNEPGAGDIWWMNVPEINESYYKINGKND
ncbi:hypothetical protein [Evansella cellulosilytica]|uniref:Uncharacterized protein n=1 Tax=Evansella cellulosilytica (strain ATCC 21833 / DSM 2522 / FERM P-1141 / JCM 9156 / N-4) TaxID=649639 RepID=E6TT54_EVAC2|nr:hypothetical protein [Evansella cellulosilytica]ADU31962.1 hypothetical protein Bcell_3722 [Evansella cellulosilytica DSM 2522]